LSLRLLGGFELKIGRQNVPVPVRVQRLAAFLALRDRPLHRSFVAGRLWLESSQEQANTSLRVALWGARRLDVPLVDASTTHIGLSPLVSVDARELAAYAERVLFEGTPVSRQALSCLVCAGDLLPDWYDEWINDDRTRLHQLRVSALECATERLLDIRRYTEAAAAGLAAVRCDPLRERSRCLLIRSYLASGNVVEALREFHEFRALLWKELRVEPSPALCELMETCASPSRPRQRL
jgi:DNA-binding SARP family transcriptional activator